MKKRLLLSFLFAPFVIFAQVGIGTTSPNSSSILELKSTSQGLLTPRMTKGQRNAITSPATGLLIYQTNNTAGFYYYDGSNWVTFGGGDTDWTISGNNIYNANTENVGVGTITPSTKFHIKGTASGGGGGSSTIYSENFSGIPIGDITTTAGITLHQEVSGSGTYWESVTPTESYALVVCSNCVGRWINIRFDGDFDAQNEVFVSGKFTPSVTATSLDINFDYRYVFDNGTGERFKATLYNETDGNDVTTLVNLTNASANTSYSGAYTFSGTNAATDAYTLRFRYRGRFGTGASVDNIVVDENATAAPSSFAFRLEDGTEGAGKVLTSDANGNATWKDPGHALTKMSSINDIDLLEETNVKLETQQVQINELKALVETLLSNK